MTGFLDLGGAGAGGSGYQIPRSLRFRSSASAYLQRTLTTPTNNLKWTWSGWVKRGAMGAQVYLFNTGSNIGGQDQANLQFSSGDQLVLLQTQTATATTEVLRQTTQVFRDPSSWYHIVAVYDSANATAADRAQLWVNGSRITSFAASVDPSSSLASRINAARVHTLGRFDSPQGYFDGLLSEINFIDGQALTPSSFGETSATTGQWQAKKYTGTYGTNGFYLPFSDTTSTTTLCYDASGNARHWTPNNISLTAGATYDSMTDVPLGGGGSLGNGQGNYATLNPLNNPAIATFSEANLKITNGSFDYRGALSTIAVPTSGKFYWEFQSNATTTGSSIVNMGIAPLGVPLSGNQSGYANSAAWYLGNGVTYWIPGGTSIGSSSTSDVFQIAYDAATGKVWLGKNNLWLWGNTSTNNTTGDPAGGTNQSFTLTAGTEFYAWAFAYNNGVFANFGQRPFAYTPPTGFKALHTGNLSAPAIAKPNQHFDVKLYTGTSSSNNVTGVGFQPDLVWLKNRNYASGTNHVLVDAVRGATVGLASNLTNADFSTSGNFTSINSDGFTVAGTTRDYNFSSDTFASWLWKAGNSAGSSNTNGTITSTVSANPTAGFSIVTYTGTGANATVGHGLGVAPKMVIVKARSFGPSAWSVYTSMTGAGNELLLNSTAASAAAANSWNSTAPTASVFSIGTALSTNQNAATFVAYCFAEIAGYSKFGSYTGNGSADGPFCYCGFMPRWVMVKRTDVAGNWQVFDGVRSPTNVVDEVLFPNGNVAEAADANRLIDSTANGFKLRQGAPVTAEFNTIGAGYIFVAFAETPSKYALAR